MNVDASICKDCGLPFFQYQDLQSEPKQFAIRLIKLHPARVPDADIVIELVKNDTEQPSYDAVSWCWGSGGSARTVRARREGGDHCMTIPPNLESALRHLRFTDEFRTLWIDAICIDQTNSVEKNKQVPMMSEIYGKAQQVCVWLGDGDDSSIKAIRFIKKNVLDLHSFDNICRDDSYAEGWISLVQLMERPWISRRWVIQEIALANQRTATIICGEESISWAEFTEAVSLFDRALSDRLDLSKLRFPQRNNVSYSTRYAPALGAIRLVKATSELFRKSTYNERPFALRSLEYLVSTFTMYETSEPRDVIYSLLSISNDAFRFDAPQDTNNVEVQTGPFDHLPVVRKLIESWFDDHIVRRAFRVDYDAPIIEVYKQFISLTISKAKPSQALDIICRPWAPELRNEQFPSWISTLSNATYKLVDQDTVGKRLVRRNPDTLVGNPDSSTYNASLSIRPPKSLQIFPYFKSVERSMFLHGFVLDGIGDLAFPSQLGHVPPEWVAMGNWDPKYDEPPEDFWRTLVADRGPEGRDPLPFYPRACREVFQHSLDDTLDTTMLINHGSTIIADFLKRVQAVIWNRRLMRTKRSWLGLVPKAAHSDDLICILNGCSVPVVLRRVHKSALDIDLERKDHEARKANALLYIARMLAAHARRRRVTRGNNPTNTSTNKSTNKSKIDKPIEITGLLTRKDQPDDESLVLPAPTSETTNDDSCLNDDGKRPHSEDGRKAHESKRVATELRALTDAETADVYYVLIGECYIHGMMNGEARTFRSEYNAGKPISDRIMTKTFELR